MYGLCSCCLHICCYLLGFYLFIYIYFNFFKNKIKFLSESCCHRILHFILTGGQILKISWSIMINDIIRIIPEVHGFACSFGSLKFFRIEDDEDGWNFKLMYWLIWIFFLIGNDLEGEKESSLLMWHITFFFSQQYDITWFVLLLIFFFLLLSFFSSNMLIWYNPNYDDVHRAIGSLTHMHNYYSTF